jgi:hypothetical protein
MYNFLTNFIQTVNPIFDQVTMFCNALWEAAAWPATGSGMTLAFALGAVGYVLPEGLRTLSRQWHGSIDEQFGNINNVVTRLAAHPEWNIPGQLLAQLIANRDQLQALLNKCRTPDASQTDRLLRSALLKSTVGLCLQQVRLWAYGAFAVDSLTAEDIHELGFLLPGENAGRHERAEATDTLAEVKVSVVSEDIIRVVVDQSAGENAAAVVHGWPRGVHHALIVIYAADGTTEVLRTLTTRLHNDIRMPDGSRGKLFIIKASFLKHVDDTPRFGNAPTFSMPLTTNDLAIILDRQAHEEYEAHSQEAERHRQELGD